MNNFEVLNNGAKVLHQYTVDDASAIVLCKWERGAQREFVTWTIDPNGNAFWGHYWETLEAAINDYEQRAGIKLNDPKTAPEVVRELYNELKVLMAGEKCDHDSGVCHCRTFERMELARDFLESH